MGVRGWTCPVGQAAQLSVPSSRVPAGQMSQPSCPARGWTCPAGQAVQVTPLPAKPGLQAQVKLPWVSVQAASFEQLSVPSAHSSRLVQVGTGPGLLVQVQAPASPQPPLFVAHSSRSVAQVGPV